jgi:hypothetical protein
VVDYCTTNPQDRQCVKTAEETFCGTQFQACDIVP